MSPPVEERPSGIAPVHARVGLVHVLSGHALVVSVLGAYPPISERPETALLRVSYSYDFLAYAYVLRIRELDNIRLPLKSLELKNRQIKRRIKMEHLRLIILVEIVFRCEDLRRL